MEFERVKQRINRIRTLGFINVFRCLSYRIILGIYRKFYKFDAWHVRSNFYCRPYKKVAVEVANSLCPEVVVEVGCGLGDIIGRIDGKYLFGFDVDDRVIKLAKKLNPHVKFFKGTFIDIPSFINKPIDLIIAINFLHGISPQDIRANFELLFSSLKIKYFLLDRYVPSYDGNFFRHNYSSICSRLNLVDSFSDMEGYREILLYKVLP